MKNKRITFKFDENNKFFEFENNTPTVIGITIDGRDRSHLLQSGSSFHEPIVPEESATIWVDRGQPAVITWTDGDGQICDSRDVWMKRVYKMVGMKYE